MAYTIISQNNTTTTLSDENGNVITVPARVTLATSTDYTIKKVNNNSVDLESGDGKIIRGVPACVVLAGSGGGDQHNLGYYATQSALEEAHPTAEAGDWAIVGSTDTVWIWDTDNSEWVDTDQKGQVTSVNGQTGDVVLTIPDAVQYSIMPTASVDNLGDIVQFTGTTDANYTNGYFYKCVSDGQDPATYSWSAVEVQAGGGLPDQTGNSGKFLTTDGTDASWSDKPLVNQKDLSTTNSIAVLYSGNQPTRVGDHCVVFGGNDFTNPSDYVIKIGGAGRVAGSYSTLVGYATGPSGVRQVTYGVCVGYQSRVGKTAMGIGVGNIAVGSITTSFEDYTITIGYHAAALAQGAIQIGHYEDPNNPDARTENSDANTFKVANANGNFEIMSADGTIPAARHATLPATDGTYVLKLVIANGVPTLSWVAE